MGRCPEIEGPLPGPVWDSPLPIFAPLAAVDDVRIERIGRRISVLLYSGRMPVMEGNTTIVTAAGDTGAAAILLAAADVIGKRIVGRYVVHLRGGLVVPFGPRLATVLRNDDTLI